MTIDDDALRNALGASGADEIGGDVFQHGAARQLGDECEAGVGVADDRQRQMPGGVEQPAALETAGEGGEKIHLIGAQIVQAGGGKPVEELLVGEKSDQQNASPDLQDGPERQQQRAAADIDDSAAFAGSEDAGPDGNADHQRQRNHVQQQRDRKRFLDEIENG